MAEELLLALKEDLINELVIISATPDKDWRKRKKFAKTFGKCSSKNKKKKAIRCLNLSQ